MRHTPPYTQTYRYLVPEEYDGANILDLYCERFSFRSREYWTGLIAEGNVTVNRQGIDPDYVIHEGDMIHTTRHDVTEPDVDDNYKILHEENNILVINKPAPLPVHPAGRFYKNSLTYIMNEKNPDIVYHTIHRLDTWTTGVLVLATSKDKARFLHEQMESKTIEKEYGVLAIGDFGEKEFIIDEPIGRIDGAHRGFGPNITEAKPAITKFIPISKKDNITFLKAIPITGRTNQIRVHINVAGGHVLNDPLYAPHNPQPANRPMGLHCHKMTFKLEPETPPATFIADWPEHFSSIINNE